MLDRKQLSRQTQNLSREVNCARPCSQICVLFSAWNCYRYILWCLAFCLLYILYHYTLATYQFLSHVQCFNQRTMFWMEWLIRDSPRKAMRQGVFSLGAKSAFNSFQSNRFVVCIFGTGHKTENLGRIGDTKHLFVRSALDRLGLFSATGDCGVSVLTDSLSSEWKLTNKEQAMQSRGWSDHHPGLIHLHQGLWPDQPPRHCYLFLKCNIGCTLLVFMNRRKWGLWDQKYIFSRVQAGFLIFSVHLNFTKNFDPENSFFKFRSGSWNCFSQSWFDSGDVPWGLWDNKLTGVCFTGDWRRSVFCWGGTNKVQPNFMSVNAQFYSNNNTCQCVHRTGVELVFVAKGGLAEFHKERGLEKRTLEHKWRRSAWFHFERVLLCKICILLHRFYCFVSVLQEGPKERVVRSLRATRVCRGLYNPSCDHFPVSCTEILSCAVLIVLLGVSSTDLC